MIEVRWFLWLEGEVRGPYSSEEVIEFVEKTQKKTPEKSQLIYVWWKGQTEWIPYCVWFTDYKDTDIYSPYQQNWELKKDDENLGSLPYDELVHILGNHHKELTHYFVKKSHEEQWKTVFEVEELIETLHLSRRLHPRAPLMGLAKLTDGNFTMKARLATISERGFGFYVEGSIPIGHEYWVEIDSPNLEHKIMMTAEVLYSDKSGHVGAKFIGIDAVSRSLIVEFVNKFIAAKNLADSLVASTEKKSA